MRQVLITGGSDGIGLAAARELAADGKTSVTLVARNQEKLQAAIAGLRGTGHQVLVADLTQRHDVELVADHLESRHYDVFVNNAGIGLYGEFAAMPLEDQLAMMSLNMESVVVLSHRFVRQAKEGDALVNTASFLAYTPLPGAAVYSATKAFVAVLSETLWWECKTKGIYVLGFSPGVTATGFHSAAGSSLATFPRALVQSPESAAQELVRALERRAAPRAISGLVTRLLVGLQRFTTRRATINLLGNYAPVAERNND